ncbi:tetratricopeptide repeat protein [Solidesulfovibrio sp.]|jgi:tetratricopeptide (TPR) repeat protein|uniref:tetratricopeptide repeat protein n=1 Tax=Solidesulfovibrio sp. TaxID=2910990 RepID=UPI002B20DB47|nr:tetratricopeptide repeat protein [Solidesulfovibrio sp.]MEA5087345.1 tetratricopeptide repeat protein [Solidesulfovibrio sp.]
MDFSPILFDTVVIVSKNEENARRDRRTLASFRPRRVEQFASGEKAMEFLVANRVDVVLLDSQLEDMEDIQFLRLTRRDLRLKDVPIVMVTAQSQRDKVLDAIAVGCAGYILRPYSEETFAKHVLRGCQVERVTEIERQQIEDAREMVAMGNFDDAIEAFEEIISEQNMAQKYYDMGCRCLVRQKYGQAIIAFKKAIKINDLFAEAYKGLADAYKGKGELEEFKRYLQKAAEIHAQFNHMEETKELFIEILKYDANTPNPFNSLGVKLRKSGDLAGALHAYEQALSLTPDDENIHFNMSKAYYFMGDTERAKVSVDKALAISPGFEEGRKLYRKLFGREYPRAAAAPPKERAAEAASMRDV